jgi:tetratricopeptide (TPR) repeat protein
LEANLINQALEYHQQGKIKEAQELYLEILNADPDNVNALYLNSLALSSSGQFEEALGHVKKAISIAPQVDLYKLFGELCYETGRYEDALSAYEKVASVEVESEDIAIRLALVHQKLGVSLYQQGKYREAVKHFE